MALTEKCGFLVGDGGHADIARHREVDDDVMGCWSGRTDKQTVRQLGCDIQIERQMSRYMNGVAEGGTLRQRGEGGEKNRERGGRREGGERERERERRRERGGQR